MENKLEKIFTWPKQKPTTPHNHHHWFGKENASVLKRFIDLINPKYILEMGSWTGAGSTKYILEQAPNAHLVCIDHWSKNLEDYVQKDYGMEQVIKLNNTISVLWETFLVNTWEYQHRLTPVRMKTVDGLQTLKEMNISFDLIYIDAHHDYESVLHDISVAHQFWPNAIIVGDDYLWPRHEISKAVNEIGENNNLQIKVEGNCWYYKKN